MAEPTGRFGVGYASLVFSDPQDKRTDPLTLDPEKHLVGALFYPADSKGRKSKQARWLPAYGYAYGFAYFIGIAAASRGLLKLFWPLLRSILAAFTYLLGHSKRVAAAVGLPLSDAKFPHPIVILSHGVGGNRMVQSCICCELASQGFVVLSIEHADGSASAARLVGNYRPEWLYFQIAPAPAERARRILHRIQEVKTAARLLGALSSGIEVAGLSFPDAAQNFIQSLKGHLDMTCLATLGHSFGGGPACALPLEAGDVFKCGIGMDPYWPPLPVQHPVFTKAESPSPLLLIGCQTWNDAAEKSYLKSDLEKEKAVMQAASSGNGGGGCIALVLRGIGHASFTDADLLFGQIAPSGSVPKQALQPQLAISILKEVVLTFLKAHLPLSDAQRRAISPHSAGTAGRQQQSAESGPGKAVARAAVALGTEAAEGEEAFPASETAGKAATEPDGPHSSEQASKAGKAGRGAPVTAAEESTYRDIVGEENVFSLKIQV